MKKFLILFSGIASMMLLSGCGNISNPNIFRIMDTGSSKSPTLTSSLYNCSMRGTIVPQGNSPVDGSGVYQICPSSDPSNLMDVQLEVNSNFENSRRLCVFPALQASSSYVRWVADPKNASSPYYKCGQPTEEDGLLLSFGGIRTNSENTALFNAAFVVEEQYLSQMRTCLLSSFAYCPPYYSYGQFR